MEIEVDFPQILLKSERTENEILYKESIKNILKKVFPQDLFEHIDQRWTLKNQSFFNESLPIIRLLEMSSSFSIILLCKYRPNVTRFFFDMIHRWLTPNKKSDASIFFSANFKLSDLFDQTLTIHEMIVPMRDEAEIVEVKQNWQSVESEVRLGVLSDYQANRIMEFKGLSADRKTTMIQEKISDLMKNRSKDFGKSIFSHMQHFLVTCREDFKSIRDHHHISRIISILYLMRKMLKQKIEDYPSKRHLILKFLKTKLYLPEREKSVLGILVGLNFLKEHEVFEKNHLIKAIRRYIHNAKAIENSFFVDRSRNNNIQTVYLEVEKEDGKDFSFEEIKQLRFALSKDLKGYIEHLMHPIFMPRNEEEIVRNIMTLSRQLRYVHDLPQVIISFDQQTGSEISFTIILLRVHKANTIAIKEVFQHIPSSMRFVMDRVKKVGILRRKYVKEANVFRLYLPTVSYMRDDNSIDMNKARFDVLSELNRIFGEVRDYNGGLILKQKQAFLSLKTALKEVGKQYDTLLEKFFYSILPAEMTVIQNIESLKQLFLMLISAIKREDHQVRHILDSVIKKEKDSLFVIIPIADKNRKKSISEKIEKMHIPSSQFLYFDLISNELSYLGYIYFSSDEEMKKEFIKRIQLGLDF